MIKNDLYLKALRGETVERPPVWMMRQAGRYLPEFIALRDKYDFFTRCQTPELASEITVQPIRRFPLDAAILFSDILVVPQAMGIDFKMKESVGPWLDEPIRTAQQVDDVIVPDVNETLGYVFDAIEMTLEKLDNEIPLIGFAGGPFTVASYMVEGGSSKELAKLKGLMFSNPKAFHLLLEKLSALTAAYLCEQIRQGVHAVTIMDSWAGYLSPSDYREFVLPHTKSVVRRVQAACPGVPVIHYANGAPTLLNDFVSLGVNVVGLDWRVELPDAFKAHPDQVFQGNLDPTFLFSPPEKIMERVKAMKQVVGSRPHVWNLGHGILPQTPVENAREFVRAVHEE